jgi:hypothetical protein
VQGRKKTTNVSVDFLCSFDEIGSNVAHMKQPEYTEGPEALQNFKNLATAILQAPQALRITRIKPRRTLMPDSAERRKPPTSRNPQLVAVLVEAWAKYRWLFNCDPHGTPQQVAALLELIPQESWELVNGKS